MKHIALGILIIVVVCGTVSAQSAGELYQQGLVQENGVGNLANAIDLYQRAAKQAGGDRAIAVLALMGAARCYEKLGRDESTRLYQQILRDYPDQRDQAALAQERVSGRLVPLPRTTGTDHSALMAQLATLRQQHADMMRKYTPGHPDVVFVSRQIADLEKAIELESRSAVLWDTAKPVRFTGKVTSYEITNPSVRVTVQVGGANGQLLSYRVVGMGARALIEAGWSKQTFKPGDVVTVEGILAADGSPSVSEATLTLQDGRKLFTGRSNFP